MHLTYSFIYLVKDRTHNFHRFNPFWIYTVHPHISVDMYYSHPLLLANSHIAHTNLSDCFHVINDGSPSRIRRVRRISLGMTTRPRSSIRLTIPVAFIEWISLTHLFLALLLFAGIGGICGKSGKFRRGCDRCVQRRENGTDYGTRKMRFRRQRKNRPKIAENNGSEKSTLHFLKWCILKLIIEICSVAEWHDRIVTTGV